MRNLVKLYNQSDKSGKDWYRQANEFCRSVATKYDIELPVVCAILSALSPGTNWEVNKRDCEGLIVANKGGKYRFRFTTYGQNVIKAQRIYKGELSPFEAFNPKTGAKTYNFFLNVLNPENPVPVTIDRHTYTVATGETYKGLTPKQYGLIVEHYHKAASKLGILASELQAVLWVSYREKENISFEIQAPF